MDTAVAIAAVLVAALLAARLSLPDGVAAIWIGGGILIPILVVLPPRRWAPSITLATIAWLLYFADLGWVTSAAVLRTVGELVTIIVIALLVRRYRCLPMHSLLDVARMVAIAFGAGVARFVVVAAAVQLDPAFDAAHRNLPNNTFMNTFVGVLVVAPVGVALAPPPAWHRPSPRQLVSAVPSVVAVLLLIGLLQVAPFAPWWTGAELLAFAVMLMATLTLPTRGLAVMLLTVTLVITSAVIRGVGPFHRSVSDFLVLQSDTFRAQVLLAILAMTTWSLSVVHASWVRTRNERDATLTQLNAAVGRASVPMSFGPLIDGHVDANEAMAEFFGVTVDQMRDLDWRSVTHPDDLAEDLRLTTALSRGDIDEFTLLKRYVLADGTLKWGQLNIVRIDGPDEDEPWGVAQIVDMTAEIEARQQLEQTRERLRTIVHKASIPMSFGPMDNGLAEVNDARCAFHERTREELASLNWTELIHPDDLAAMQGPHQALVNGEIDRYRLLQRCLMPDGSFKWGDVTAARLDLDDATDDFVVVQIVDVTAEVESRAKLQHLVDTDQVTGMHSRSWITDALQRVLAAAEYPHSPVAAMFLDVAEFDVVTRTLGYEAGDEVVASLARAVLDVLPAGWCAGRFSGHRLLIVAPDAGDPAQIRRTAERILRTVASEIDVRGSRISRTGSIGIAMSAPGSTAISMLRAADDALTHAKNTGRSRTHVLRDGDRVDPAVEPLRLEHELRLALDERQFVLYYQPQVRLSDGTVCGREALVRWRNPERGLLSPAMFMDLMESSGLIVPLGRQILAMACNDIAGSPSRAVPISINVSAVELMEPDWFANFEQTVRRFDIPAGSLTVELTETTVLQLTPDASQALAGIRRMGVGLHIDDFGTGYASIGVLQQVPLTGIKLDRSFVAPLVDPTQSDLDLVRSIASLAHGLRLDAIAEGIETPEQARLLSEAGWQFGQGYLYGRPAPISPELPRPSGS